MKCFFKDEGAEEIEVETIDESQDADSKRKRGRPRIREMLGALKRRTDRSVSSTQSPDTWIPRSTTTVAKLSKLKSASKKYNSRRNSVSQHSSDSTYQPYRRKRHYSNSSCSSSSSSANSNDADSTRPLYNYYANSKKYDIDNIVIPYDMVSSSCKATSAAKRLNVPIPQWRELAIEPMSVEEMSSLDESLIEDLDEKRYLFMHETREAKEKSYNIFEDKSKRNNNYKQNEPSSSPKQ